MPAAGDTGLILGLDLGVGSVGWALIKVRWAVEMGDSGRWVPFGIERMGARIFDPGTDAKTLEMISKGRDESRGVARRLARQMRKNFARRTGRLKQLFRLLHDHGFLPPLAQEDGSEFQRRDACLKALDASILSTAGRDSRDWHVKLPYMLREAALNEPIREYELGRVLYHLAQRRGFKSNRKAAPKADEMPGALEQEFVSIESAMQGEPSLGSWLSQQDPHLTRIRGRHTRRDMVEAEFVAIWNAQAIHHPALRNEAFREAVHRAIFYQRPLKSAGHLIGWCSLEPGRWVEFVNKNGKLRRVYRAPRRAPRAHLLAQRFRLLQKANDLEILFRDGRKAQPTTEQRKWLIGRLEQGDLGLRELKTELGLGRFDQINLGDEVSGAIPGNRTTEKLQKIFGSRWHSMKSGERDEVVFDCLTIEDPQALMERGILRWGLDAAHAKSFAELRLEPGYLDVSLKAIRRLLPDMERGVRYATARKNAYGEAEAPQAEQYLPPVSVAFPALRNPIVTRTLNELRKVVNAILSRHGRPVMVRIELARDMKKSRGERKRISERIEDRRKEREKAWVQVQEACLKAGIMAPRGRRLAEEKWLLWEECRGICPYTGRQISFGQLFVTGEVEIEHIVPYCLSLDDSFQNKTLCFRDANQLKNARLPVEAFSNEQMSEILQRIEGWDGKAAPGKREKLRRFRLLREELDPGFITSQLTDTAYASKDARKFLGLLYGGLADAAGIQRVQSSKGQLTSMLRRQWGLNAMLGTEEREKNRGDHRHHAVDALVIALTEPAVMQKVSFAFQRNQEGKLFFKTLELPWDGFLDEAKRQVDAIIVSHRQDKKVNGRIHEATFYRKTADDKAFKRKKIEDLSPGDVESIRNAEIRRIIESALIASGGQTPKQAFKDPKAHPCLNVKTGHPYPVHKVVVEVKENLIQVGEGDLTRWAPSDSNHHMVIMATNDRKGQQTWTGHVVNRQSAMRRLRDGVPVVQRPKDFIMSLSEGDFLRWEEDGKVIIMRVRTAFYSPSLNQFLVDGVDHREARLKSEIQKSKEWIRKSLKQLKDLSAEKVMVTPLGDVRRCGD